MYFIPNAFNSFAATDDNNMLLQTALIQLIWLVSSGSTLFDIQSFNFTYNNLSKRQFVNIKKKADDKCRLKFGAERVKHYFTLDLANSTSKYTFSLF